ncbi:MAG: hypothetical protein C5B49_12380 [Bdellovibrio sp.]|nr:MAG: hypothetical protein C5B49_12380 [Bdellovibrio sp.]
MSSPIRKINLDSIPWKKFALEGPVELEFRDPGRAVGSLKIGLRIQKVQPGKQSSRLHRHLYQEEILIVMSGEGFLRHGEEKVKVKPGDCICYHAGDESPHTFVAEGKDPLVIYAFGDRCNHEICQYPEVGLAFVEGLNQEVKIENKPPKTLMAELDQ